MTEGPEPIPFPESIRDAMHQLLGCQWGRIVNTKDDQDPCPNRATRLVQLHDPRDINQATAPLKFCDVHVAKLESMSTPTNKARLKAWEESMEEKDD